MDWTSHHFRLPIWIGQAFIVEKFIKNESITATQRIFRVHFGLGRHDPVPTQNTILLWVTNFKVTGSILKRNCCHSL